MLSGSYLINPSNNIMNVLDIEYFYIYIYRIILGDSSGGYFV